MKELVVIGMVLMMASGGFAFDADFTVDVAEIVNSFIVSWTGSYTNTVSGNTDEIVYLANGERFSSCSGNAVIWTTTTASGTIEFTVSNLNEDGADFKFEVGGVETDIMTNGDKTIPYSGASQKVCLKAKLKADAQARITTTDLTVVEG